MADTNINIYLKGYDDSNATTPKDPGTTPDANNPTKNKKDGADGKKSTAVVVGTYVAKSALQFAESSVGWATRDNLKQQQTNAFNKLVAYGAATIANPALGIAAFTLDMVKSTIEYNRAASQENRVLSIMRERAGNINRSR